jgi:ketosteroid isomerase-like protein
MRRSVEAYNRRDRTAWLELRDEDCEIIPIGDWPDSRVIRGRDAAWNFYVDVGDTLDFRAVDVDLVAAGSAKVLIHQRHAAQGRASRADVEVDLWTVVTFRDGAIVRDEWFSDRAGALKAAGLSE